MSRDVVLYLEDIRDACAKVMRYTEGMSFKAFLDDERTFDAVIRNLEVIGEAAKQVPEDLRDRHPDVDWRRIAGLRDVLIHGYFGLEDETLWDIVQNKVPELHGQIDGILDDEAGADAGEES